MQKNIGILAVGVHLPENVRRNDHWPRELVEKWRAKTAARMKRTDDAFASQASEGTRLVLDAMRALGDDPFQGIVERRAMGPNATAADMEAAAAREAIARSGIDPALIDV